jgi:hypothetical protein
MGLCSTEAGAAVQFKRVFTRFGEVFCGQEASQKRKAHVEWTTQQSPKPKVKATQSTTLILALIRFIVLSHPHSPLSRLASSYLVIIFE